LVVWELSELVGNIKSLSRKNTSATNLCCRRATLSRVAIGRRRSRMSWPVPRNSTEVHGNDQLIVAATPGLLARLSVQNHATGVVAEADRRYALYRCAGGRVYDRRGAQFFALPLMRSAPSTRWCQHVPSRAAGMRISNRTVLHSQLVAARRPAFTSNACGLDVAAIETSPPRDIASRQSDDVPPQVEGARRGPAAQRCQRLQPITKESEPR